MSLLLILLSYFVGAVPTSYLLVRYRLGKDIRQMGSGNSGATNTGRFLGQGGFLAVLFIDAFKAYFMLALVGLCAHESTGVMLSAIVALYLGNAYSPFIAFHGGKGVATTAGIILFLFPLWLFFFLLFAFVLFFFRFRRVDVASLGASALAPLVLLCAGYQLYVVSVAAGIAAWIWIRHESNVRNLFGNSKF